MDLFLNNLLCVFRKTHFTQHALSKLLHSWQREFDNSGLIGTVLMDLSKAYDSLPHDLIIAHFEAYGLSKNGIELLLDYLEGRKQLVKIGSSCSFWFDVKRVLTYDVMQVINYVHYVNKKILNPGPGKTFI